MEGMVERTLLKAKLVPPTREQHLFHESALALIGEACRAGHSVVVQAPAGFAKLSLLRSFYQTHDDVAWVTLDSADSCWTLKRYAQEALARISPSGTLIVTGLGAMPAAQEAYDCLLEMIGPDQTLVVGSSAHIESADARFITADDLRLSVDEVREASRTDAEARAVWELAWGWPVASYLIIRADCMGEGGAQIPDDLLKTLGMYCEEEVIDRLGSGDIALLSLLSLLPAPVPEVVDRLTGAAPQVLQRLYEETPFIIEDDGGQRRFLPIYQMIARRTSSLAKGSPNRAFVIDAASAYARAGYPQYAAWCAVLVGSYRRAAAHIIEALEDEAHNAFHNDEAMIAALAQAIAEADGGPSASVQLDSLAGQPQARAALAAVVDFCMAMRKDPATPDIFSRVANSISEALEREQIASGEDAPQQGTAHEAPRLTATELKVMALLADGQGPRQIAQMTNTSEATVRTHIKHAYRKLGAHGKKDALQKAIALGIV